MDRSEHQSWLKRLAAEDARRRALAEPELARKEAELRDAQGRLAATKAEIAETEAALELARRELRATAEDTQGL